MNRLLYILCLAFLVFFRPGPVSGADGLKTPEAIMKKLCSVAGPVRGYLWPPVVELTADTVPKINVSVAYNGQKDKFGFRISLTQGIYSFFSGQNNDLPAFMLAHELAHIELGHIAPEENGKELIRNAVSHEEEFEADSLGLKIALDAGYKYKEIIRGVKELSSLLPGKSDFESLSTGHPGWSERLARLDGGNKEIWRSLAAFDNGITFLSLNQYDAAIYCFHYIIDQFPDCYEAMVNVGYAALMKYVETLDSANFRDINCGLFISGNFYKSASSLKNRIRGIDEDLWWVAVGEFQAALRIKPDLTLAKANLGLAYLISPNPQVYTGKAAMYLSEAAALAENDTTLDKLGKAIINMNAGLSYAETDSVPFTGSTYIGKAEGFAREFAETHQNVTAAGSTELYCALRYNKAQMLIRSGRKEMKPEAARLLAEFLMDSDAESPWWDIAYTQYSELCTESGSVPLPEIAGLKANPSAGQYKKIVKIEAEGKHVITLSDRKDVLLSRLGRNRVTEQRIIPGQNLVKLNVEGLGTEIYTTDFIFAVKLVSEKSPKIILEKKHKGKGPVLFVGMAAAEFETIVGNAGFIDKTAMIYDDDRYRYYFDLGLAVKFTKDGKSVRELIIVQL